MRDIRYVQRKRVSLSVAAWLAAWKQSIVYDYWQYGSEKRDAVAELKRLRQASK